MRSFGVSKQTLQRLPMYLAYLRTLSETEQRVSASSIASALNLNDVQVRKDLASVSSSGRPKIGYPVQVLREELESFLGYCNIDSAVIVGAGHLGRALLNYGGFKDYGLEILAAFDINDCLVGQEGGRILPLSRLPDICDSLHPRIGIITVPAEAAQEVCDLMVSSGIEAIWNFAPVHLRVDDKIFVTNENMAVHLAVISNYLRASLRREANLNNFDENAV
ncbi:MAG: redox-sensing transcriptional repressor Rex [Candidatus Bruticola sp.]